MNNLVYLIARYLSAVFVPPSFTFLIFLYIGCKMSRNISEGLIISGLGLLLGLIIPVVFFFYLMKKGKVGDTDATIKEERNIPYSFGIMLSACGMVLSLLFKLPEITAIMWGIYLINMFLLLVINKYWKISAHALGASIPLGFFVFLFNWTGLLYFPLVILIGWSRIYLKKHDTFQVIAGSITGFSVSLLVLYLI